MAEDLILENKNPKRARKQKACTLFKRQKKISTKRESTKHLK